MCKKLLYSALIISLSLPATVRVAAAASLKLCLKTDTSALLVKKKCGKKLVQVDGTTLGSLVGSQSSNDSNARLDNVENDIQEAASLIESINNQVSSLTNTTANLSKDISSVSNALPGDIMHVRVSGDAAILSSSTPATVFRQSLGYFRVSFDRDVTGCFYQASPTATVSQVYPFGVDALVRPQNSVPDTLEIFMYNSVANTSVDLGFTLTVSCP